MSWRSTNANGTWWSLLKRTWCEMASGPQPKFRALIAEWDAQPAGYAFFFGFYSTWEGRPNLFLEDLFVRSQFRGKGIGKALLAHVAGIAQRENCCGVRWEVLD
ncbi:MAG: GNAT family N-acetyltransferase [Candidatus Acidiferrales bacterium]